MNSLLTSAALWPLETMINGLIQSDGHLANKLSPLSDTVVQVKTRKPDVVFCIQILNPKISLKGLSSSAMNINCDASIEGDSADFLSLLTTKNMPLSNPALKIEGNAELIHQLFNLLLNLDLRWDDLLAPYLGDITTHSAKNLADELSDLTTRANDSFRASVDEYLKEEAKILPTGNGLDNFTQRLDALRLGLDRANARLERLGSTSSQRDPEA